MYLIGLMKDKHPDAAPSREVRMSFYGELAQPYQRNEPLIGSNVELPPLLPAAHQCMMCDSAFATIADRDIHELMHMTWQTCPQCGKELKSTAGLKLHVELEHGPRKKLSSKKQLAQARKVLKQNRM